MANICSTASRKNNNSSFRDHSDFNFEMLNLPFKGNRKISSILHPQNGSEIAEPPYTFGEKAIVDSKYTLSQKYGIIFKHMQINIKSWQRFWLWFSRRK